MTTPQNILLIGATGNIGQHILTSIVRAKSHFNRIAVLTSANTISKKADFLRPFEAQGVEVIAGDITSESDVKNALKGIDTVVSCVGRGVISMQDVLVKWAMESGIKKFYPSEYGTDIAYFPHSKDEKPHQAKLKVRAALERSGMEYTYVVVGPYPEMFLVSSLPAQYGKFDAKTKKATLLGDGEARIGFTAMPDVGELVVAALLHPKVSANKALRVNSFTATYHDILAEFERQTGSKWDVSYTSLEELKKLEEDGWRDGHPMAAPMTLRRIWTEGGSYYGKTDNDLIEAPPMDTLQHQVELAIKEQTK